MRDLLNGRRVALVAFGLTLLAATMMLAPEPSHAYGRGRAYYGGGYRGGAPVYVSRARLNGGGWYGGRGYRGGARYYRGAPRYYYGGPRHYYPRSYVSFGFGVGLGAAPYYPPPAYYHYPHPQPPPTVVYKEKAPEAEPVPVPEIEVGNEPPAGCYYYDSHCDREFKNLDGYTDHLDETDEGHPNTIRIVSRDSGKRIRTLEFVGGYWEVRQESQ